MRIQIVYPDDSWILEKIAKSLIDKIPGATGSINEPHSTQNFDLSYYVNYRVFRSPANRRLFNKAFKLSRLNGGLFTHRENDKYELIARSLDFCVAMCQTSLDQCKAVNQNSHLIYIGTDFERFTPKIRLGVVGRYEQYNGRKGEDLFEYIRKIPYVELHVTGGKLSDQEIPSFYQSIDYVLITSKVEGGPMCFPEGLASGKEIISTDVGMVKDLKNNPGIYIYDRDQPETLHTILKELYAKRLALRKAVEKYTTDYFVNEHIKLFETLTKDFSN